MTRKEKQLSEISKKLGAIRKNIVMYSGVSKKEAEAIDDAASYIAEQAAEIAAEARVVMGNRGAKTLVKRVRKALGYTYP